MSSPEAPETEAAGAPVRAEEVAAEPTEPTEPTAPTDELRAGILAAFETELGDAIVDSHIRPNDDLWLRIRTDAWATAADAARNKLGFRYFNYLSAIDWRPSPFGRYEDAEVDTPLSEKLNQPFEIQTGIVGGDTRFQVIARVGDVVRHHGVTLKADVPDDTMTIDTWSKIYAGADWHERETLEMFGITFAGHPDPRHIYLPSEFEGHPLRKDYALLARVVKPWPGIVDVEGMPGVAGAEEEAEATEGGDA